MRGYLIVFIFFFRLASAFGQDPDTLLSSILQIENPTRRVDELYRYGYYLLDKDPQLAYEYARHCEAAAQKSGSLYDLSKSNNLSGQLFCNQGNYKKALDHFEKYMAISKELNDTLLLAYASTNLGNIFLRLNQFQKAEHYFLSAIGFYNFLHSDIELANGLINLGALNHTQGQLDAALNNYEKALDIGKKLNEYDIRSICLNNIAQVFSDKGELEKALAYNYDALELRDLMGADIDVSDSYLSIAEVALKQNNPELAEENLGLALTLCDKLAYAEGKMTYHQLASELYAQKENYQLAYEHLKQAGELKDNLLALQEEESADISEETPVASHPKHVITGWWLLILLSLLLIIIPFILFRYKR